jgi:endonuclease/exonuclease/phosphatase family metal-dependent hydrolase
LASKGFQRVRLELAPGVELDVYNSHLDASGGDADQAARASQVTHLIQSMTTTSAGRAILFLGDTNLKPRRGRDAKTLRRWFEATGLRCACLASRKTCCARIDRVLYRSGYGLTLKAAAWGVAPGFSWQGKPLSDHDPIHVRLRWKRRAL